MSGLPGFVRRGAVSGLARAASAIAFAALLAAAPVDANASPVTVNFDAVDTSGGSVTGAAVDAYLAGFGITLVNVTPSAGVYISTPPTADNQVVLTSSPNYLRQWWNGINGTSFDLRFADELEFLSVTIPQILPGVIVPAWSLTALDSNGASLGSYGGGLSGASAARTFTFTAPNIAALRVSSNVYGIAGMGGIPIDDVMFTVAPEAVPEPGTLALLGFGLVGLGYRRRRRSA